MPSQRVRQKQKQSVPPGFRAPPKPKFNVMTMSVRELQDHHRRNANVLLTAPSTSTASYIPRLHAEQIAIEARLDELGVNSLEDNLRMMSVSSSSSYPLDAAAVNTKRRILASLSQSDEECRTTATASLGLQEAIEIERKAHAADLAKQERERQRRQRKGIPEPDEILTREEKEARIWAFMNYRPSLSDMEDEDDDDDDEDNDPLSWFDDDQDDGRKGQDIVDPDVPDGLSNMIRVDESRIDCGIYPAPD